MNRFLAGLRYIEDNLATRFTVAHVARAAGYSAFHYCRLFHALTGDSVMGYARKRRLTVAAQQLTTAAKVRRIGKLPRGLYGKRLPGGRFAVFTHKLASRDIGGELRRSFGFIYGTCAPNSGAKLRAPYDLEL